MRTECVICLVSVLSVAVLVHSDDKPHTPFKEPPTAYECRWADGPINIDGKGDDAAWKGAQDIEGFYLPWLGKNVRAARTKTKAKLLWDREHFYFLADMDDADLFADVKEHDGQTWDNDVFELFFKPAENKHGYYEFQVNAAGTVLDIFFPRRGGGHVNRFKKDGEFHVDAKVHLRGTLNKWTDRDQGWSVEGRIPWRDFLRTGGRPEPNESWKFALCRYDYSVDFEGPDLSTIAPLKSLPHADFHHHEDYATLKFTPPSAPSGAKKTPGADAARLSTQLAVFDPNKFVPLTTSRVTGSPDPPPPFRVARVYPKMTINFPVAVARQPGSDLLLYITENSPYSPTAIHRMKDDPTTDKAETLLKLDGVAYDICFHPKFTENGYLYIGHNSPSSGKSADKKTKVSRYTIQPKPPYTFDPKSEKVIIEWPSDGHNGGAICFGLDGMMYVTSGDGTSDSDTNIKGQGMDHLLSKVLRIDVDHPDADKPYSVPKDNPFVGMKDARPETWAIGLRNPWRITCDKKTGHIWVGTNGQDLWETAHLVRKGENYGWSVYEGSHIFYPNRKLGPTPHTLPTIEHHHSEFRSLTGGIVYHGAKFPDLQGAYIYGDYSTGKIWGMKHDGTKPLWHKELASTRMQISGFGEDKNGEILICDHHGEGKGGLFTFEQTPKDTAPSNFPHTLSTSGLFQSVKGHVMQPALIPYSVNAPLWSDGTHKERWLGLPGPNPKFDLATNRGWNLPDQTVIVKSFALDMEEGNPASRKWIETRFLTNQQGEWFGYSYRWNDEQSEGTLVEGKGQEEEFRIKVPKSAKHPDGVRGQKWRYPSRAECMVCHSRAANWVLGLTELQMNKDNDYNGVRCNQLALLEQLGVLRVNYLEETKTAMREELKASGKSEKEINEYMDRQTATRDQREARTSSLLSYAPEKYKKLVDPYDPKADLMLRARSYLHSNCAHCHVEAGGGNAQIDLEFATKLDRMKLVDVKPTHHTFDLPDAKLIAPGQPDRSVLLHRLAHRSQGHMPPLATSVVDKDAAKLMAEWIRAMRP